MEWRWVMGWWIVAPPFPPPPKKTTRTYAHIPPPKKLKYKQDIAYVRELIVGALPDNLKHQAEGQVVAKA